MIEFACLIKDSMADFNILLFNGSAFIQIAKLDIMMKVVSSVAIS